MAETELKIVTHPAAFGIHDGEHPVETMMRVIALAFGNPDEWPEKYGTNYENDVFLMRRECWCEKNDGSCPWCLHGDHPDFMRLLRERFGTTDYKAHEDRGYYDPPNFWYKPGDFRMSWYKYIGRSTAVNMDAFERQWLSIIFATHPKGITIEAAVDDLERRTRKQNEQFDAMLASLSVIGPRMPKKKPIRP